jgi:arylsulfatase A-like enzyme
LGCDADQKRHDYLYWEFYEGGVSQALLLDGRWKAIRLKKTSAPIQVFDLRADIGETKNVAEAHPQLVARAAALMKTVRTDNAHWKLPAN